MNQALVTVAGSVLALVGLWGLWLRRTGAGPEGDAIRIVTSRHVGTKQLVTLIEVDGERLLLGIAGDQVSLVARLGATAIPASRSGGGPGGAAPSDHRGATAAPPGAPPPRAPATTD
jgi:flagellar biogenesis protein FliO